MPVVIRGMGREEVSRHDSEERLKTSLFRMIDAMYREGVRDFITEYEPGVDLICAEYIARNSGDSMKDACLEGVFRRRDDYTPEEKESYKVIRRHVKANFLKIPKGEDERLIYLKMLSRAVIEVRAPEDRHYAANVRIEQNRGSTRGEVDIESMMPVAFHIESITSYDPEEL